MIPGSQQVAYRNHRVPSISGSNRITDVRNAMDVLRGQVRAGDRLLVYVTAHGGSAKEVATIMRHRSLAGVIAT